jgi:molybdopterin/thiamine biosynthesis adenylyltransferase
MNAVNSTPAAGSKTVVVVGAGGIGTYLLPLVARMPAVGCVTIIDHDCYEEKNRASQAITAADVGQPKALRQAARLSEIAPRLRVTPLVERVENVPPGVLRADVIAGCLDSLHARRAVSRGAWKMATPYVDAAVQGDGGLARYHVYRPDANCACFECLWDARDYDAERETFACDGTRIEAPPSNAPGSLCSLAAAFQAIEMEKILADDWQRVASGREVLIDANSHRHFVTRLPRNADCRFDHRTLTPRQLRGTPETLSLAALFALGAAELRVEGQPFAVHWACGACRTAMQRFGLRHRLASGSLCRECGRTMRPVGFHSLDRLTAADVPHGMLDASLASLGFRAGDIFGATIGGEEVHYEIITPEEAAS